MSTKEIESLMNGQDLRIAEEIKKVLHSLRPEKKIELLDGLSEEDFIGLRVDMFMEALVPALEELTPAGAEEYAYHECMVGMIDTDQGEIEKTLQPGFDREDMLNANDDVVPLTGGETIPE